MSGGGGGCAGGGGGTGGGSCTSVSLGKMFRRALRGGGRRRGRRQLVRPGSGGGRRAVVVDGGVSSSVELISSGGSGSARASWSEAAVEARRESVVRVVLSGGVVEVYAGVVLARTVIRRHPPGLCLAHPDVFRNPHGAMVRPLEPLFPGQKFFLLPETTIQKLQRNILECSVGAFSSSSDDEPASTDATAMSSISSESESESESEEERDETAAPPDGYCCANDYFVDRERWAEWHFKMMVAEGQRSSASKPKKRRPKGFRKKRSDLATAPSCGTPTRPTLARLTRTTWEPSLPSVEEEAEEESPDDHLRPTSSEDRLIDHEIL